MAEDERLRVPFAHRRQAAAHRVLGAILEVVIHDHDELAERVRETAHDGVVLPEVPAEAQVRQRPARVDLQNGQVGVWIKTNEISKRRPPRAPEFSAILHGAL